MLSDQERLLVDAVFSRGPSALLEQGHSLETAAAWLRRPDVMEAFNTLDREYRNQDVFAERIRFVAKRSLAQFAQGAVAVLAQGMAGPVYLRDKNGAVLLDAKGRPQMSSPGPTDAQLASANSVLDRLGVESSKKSTVTDVLNILNMLGMSETKKLPLENADPTLTEEQRALSREKVRVRMLQIVRSGAVQEGHARIADVLKVTTTEKKPKVKGKPNNIVSSGK